MSGAMPSSIYAGAVALVIAVNAAMDSAAQDPRVKPNVTAAPASSATIRGRVVASDRRVPLTNARVELVNAQSEPSSTTVTDSTGEFVFRVVPGRYWVRAELTNWLTSYFGQSRAGEQTQSIVVAAREVRSDVEITMHRLGVLTGRVLDPHGLPVERASISVLGADLQIAQTNDLGEFRVPRLLPGHYVAWAIPPRSDRGTPSNLAVTYAGGSQDTSSLQSIEVAFGGESSTGDIVLVPAQMREVSGRITTAKGDAAPGAQVTLSIEHAGARTGLRFERDGVSTSSSGDFRFGRVPEGRYRLRARFGEQVGSTELVVAGGDVEGAFVTVQPVAFVSGKLTLEESAVAACRSPVVLAVPLDASGSDDRHPQTAAVGADGSFQLSAVTGRQLLQVRCGQDAFARVRRVVMNGEEVRGAIVDASHLSERASLMIVATPYMNRVVGTVSDASGLPLDGLAAVAVDDPERWGLPVQHIWTARVVNGRFWIAGLPPGRYFAFQEPPRRISEVQSPEYLQLVRARAQTFVVPESGEITLSLRGR